MSDSKILIVAGESSGDLHGAALVRALKHSDPSLGLYALGGKKMHDAGAVLIEDMLQHAVVGLYEAVRHYFTFRDILHRVLSWVDREKPALVVLIDFPGFNLRLAEHLKKRGIRIVYFVSPQIWAWGKGRIKKIQRLVDRMLVLFHFEKELYQKAGVPVTHVGHPILDTIPDDAARVHIREQYSQWTGHALVGLLPGSRINEVKAHLPIMLETARLMYAENPDLCFALGLADGISEEFVRSYIVPGAIPLTVIPRGSYSVMTLSSVAMVAAGTATLEAACFQLPMVIVYKISWLTWCFGRILVDVPFLGMVNIVAGEELVPECLQSQAKPAIIKKHCLEMLHNVETIETIRRGLQEVQKKIGPGGASARAAHEILTMIMCIDNE